MRTRLFIIKTAIIISFIRFAALGCSSHAFQSQCFDGLPGCPCFEDNTCYDGVLCLDDGYCEDSDNPGDGEESDTTGLATDPSIGAFESGSYRNLFLEIGKSESEIQDVIDVAWNQLFYGDDNHRIYYPEDDKAYILDVGNDEVRSEGMGFSMMIAVQLDKKEEFDKLLELGQDLQILRHRAVRRFLRMAE